MSPPPLLYTPEEAAQQLACSRRTVYELISSGDLESIKIRGARRIPVDAVAAYIERLRAQSRELRVAV